MKVIPYAPVAQKGDREINACKSEACCNHRAHLDQIVKDAQAVRVLALLHLHERAQLGGSEGDVSLSQNDLQLLPSCLVWWRP